MLKTETIDTIDPLTDENWELVTREIEMCDVLNNFFSWVFSGEEQEGILPEVTNFFRKIQIVHKLTLKYRRRLLKISLKYLLFITRQRVPYAD